MASNDRPSAACCSMTSLLSTQFFFTMHFLLFKFYLPVFFQFARCMRELNRHRVLLFHKAYALISDTFDGIFGMYLNDENYILPLPPRMASHFSHNSYPLLIIRFQSYFLFTSSHLSWVRVSTSYLDPSANRNAVRAICVSFFFFITFIVVVFVSFFDFICSRCWRIKLLHILHLII